MSFESNSGSVYFPLSCGIPSDIGLNVESNTGSKYFYRESNDFILWGQENFYTPPTTNNGTVYYFLRCNVPSDPDLNLESNNGSKYYYRPEFNCVSFCDSVPVTEFYIFNSDGTDKLIRPVSDSITVNIIAPDDTKYNVEP
jgi:hypothetical protein